MALEPDDADILLSLGKLYFQMGDMAGARREFQKVTYMTPENPAGHSHLAAVFVQEGEKAKAEPSLQRALALQPNDIDVLRCLARLYRDEERFDEALAFFKKVTTIDPRDTDSRFAIAAIDCDKGDTAQAEKELKEILQYDPQNTVAMDTLAKLKNETVRMPAIAVKASENAPIRVLMFYDEKGWAWWHRAHNIRNAVSKDIAIDIQQIGPHVDQTKYDFVLLFDHNLLPQVPHVPREKVIVGNSCPRILQEAIRTVLENNCLAGVVNNAAGYQRTLALTDKFFCCQNGVDHKLFYPAARPVKDLVACWVGNSKSVGNKGLDLIERACQDAGVRLRIVDAADKEIGVEANPQEWVRDQLYQKSSVFICASEFEGTPNPGLEAMACGLPVISTRVGNMVEIIQDGQNGFLVDRSAEAISEALRAMRKLNFHEMGKNARASIETGWTWEERARKYEDMFKTLHAKQIPTSFDLLSEVRTCRESDEHGRALTLLEQALVKDPNSEQLRSLYGEILLETGAREKAKTTLGAVLSSHPNSIDALNNFAMIEIMDGNTESARDLLQHVLDLSPGNSIASKNLDALPPRKEKERLQTVHNPAKSKHAYARAQRLIEEGRIPEAIKSLQSLVKVDPNHAHALNDLGALHFANGEHEEAARYLEDALAIDPDNIVTLKNLAELFAATENMEEAIVYYQRVIDREPTDVESLLAVGIIAQTLTRFDEARVFFSQALECDPGNKDADDRLRAVSKQVEDDLDKLDVRARAFIEDNNLDEAIATFKELAARQPESSDVFFNLGLCLYKNGQISQAIDALVIAVENDPTNASTSKTLAHVFIEAEMFEEGMKLLANVLSYVPDDIEAVQSLATLYDHSGRHDDAQTSFERLLELDPGNKAATEYLHEPEYIPSSEESTPARSSDVQIHLTRAEQKFDSGDFVGARDELVTAIGIDPYDAELLTISGNVHLKLGDAVAAYREYARAGHVNPFFAPAHFSLAVVLQKDGHHAQAASYAQRALDADSSHVGACKLLADSLVVQRKFREAIPILFSYLRHVENDASVFFALARCYEGQNDLISAVSMYETGLKLNPGDQTAAASHKSIREKGRAKKTSVKIAGGRPSLYIAMLTHNALDYTKKCVESIERTTIVPYKILVVDNASTDETPAWLSAQKKPHLEVELSVMNSGVPGGRNKLLAMALRDIPDDGIVVFIDNDMELFPGWADIYLDFFARHPAAGIVSAVGHRFIVRQHGRELLPRPLREDRADVACGGYACCMRAAAVRAIGEFDTRLGLFSHEDEDYSVRGLNLGFDVYALPSAPIVHHGQKLCSSNPGTAEGGSLKNQRYLARKWRKMGIVDKHGRVSRENVRCHRSTPTIGFDARTFFNIESVTSGIGHYSLYHVSAIVELKPDWDFILYGISDEVPEILQDICRKPNVKLRPVGLFDSRDVDILHICDPMDVNGSSPLEIFKGVKTTVTFYDLIPLKMYISHWTEPVRRSYMARLEQFRTRDVQLLAISEFTKHDLAIQAQVPEERITTIMAGINTSSTQVDKSDDAVQRTLKKYGITKPFFLHVGALDLHKNFDSVLRAFLESSKDYDVQLVIAGRLENFVKVYSDYVKTQGIKGVIFTDFIPRVDLEMLYSQAIALVIASLYEGFGFPLLEAMAYGCPVLSSNATSLPEVAGDATILFDPKDVRNISRAMIEMLQNPDRRELLKKNGKHRAKKFTWKKTAEKTMSVWEKMLAAPSQKRNEVIVNRRPADVSWAAAMDYSGYFFITRTCVEALVNTGVEVSVDVLSQGEEFTRYLSTHPERAAVWESLAGRNQGSGVKICAHPPAFWDGTDFYAQLRERHPGFKKYIGLTMFETDRLPTGWADACNGMDEIWVPSTFNEQTFVLGGVDQTKVKVIPFGLDLSRYQRESIQPMKIAGKKGFTFLSVFQWSDRKGWDVLLRAYLSAFTPKDDVCLVLRTYPGGGLENTIDAEINNFFLSIGHDPQCIPSVILLKDFVDETQMPSLYAAADAFVMPSRGEGWGIPYMEAMAMGLAVIGTRWGGHLDFMNDENSYLIDIDGLSSVTAKQKAENPFYGKEHCWIEPSVEHTADLMRHIFNNPTEGKEKGNRASTDIGTQWSINRTTAWINERISSFTETSPVIEKVVLPLAETPVIEQNGASVLWHAPVFNPSGYADEARNFVQHLEVGDIGVALRSISNHSPTFYDGVDDNIRKVLDKCLDRKIRKDFVNVVHFPAYAFERLPNARYNIGRTMFETDSLPPEWVQACNSMDEVWVPSEFNLETFREAGVTANLVKIPGGIDTWHFRDGLSPLSIPGAKGTVFLSMFEWMYRKGWDVLLKAWAKAFTSKDDVCLALRCYPINSSDEDAAQEIENRINKFYRGKGIRRSTLAPIIVLGDQIAESDLPRLYAAANAYVAPSRGEGWGRPQMEAMACGLPVIATRWSGNLEFMNEDNSLLLDVSGLSLVDERCEIPFYRGHRWAEPSVKHLAELMQFVVNNQNEAKAIGVRARMEMESHWRWEDIARLVQERLHEILGASQERREEKGNVPSVCWEGSQFVNHSLAVINRNICSRLIAAGYPTSVIPYEPDEFQPEEGDPFAVITKRVNAPLERVDIHVRHQWPPNLTPPNLGKWVVIQPWEFGSLPKAWAEVFSSRVDEMWVPSTYVKNVYVESGVPAERVVVIPNGFDPTVFHPDAVPIKLKTKKNFKFLFVGGTIFRKGIDILLDVYVETFTKKDDVCLVVKDMGGNSFHKGQTMKSQIAKIRKNPNAPEIEYMERILSERELAGLYVASDVLVHPYRGEGFGMPILEAMACGTPAIVTNGGAALDFCNPQNSIPVKASRKRYPEKKLDQLETVDYPWLLEVESDHLAKQMKFAVHNSHSLTILGEQASRDALRFTWDAAVVKVRERLERLQGGDPLRFSVQMEESSPVEDAYLLAIAKYQAADYQQSLDYLEVAATLINDRGLSHDSITAFDVAMRKGDCLLKMGMLQEAKEEYEQALKIRPESAEACYNLGLLFDLSGQMDGAIVMYEFALNLKPEWDEAREKLEAANRSAESRPFNE